MKILRYCITGDTFRFLYEGKDGNLHTVVCKNEYGMHLLMGECKAEQVADQQALLNYFTEWEAIKKHSVKAYEEPVLEGLY